jgi:pimeloyl-ACP methyl ester carboxylesterase
MAGQVAQLYVRERVLPGTIARSANLADRVILFVHGAGTPAEVSFDVPYQDYSWMAYLANAGYDVFSVDMSGYGTVDTPDDDERSVQSDRGAAEDVHTSASGRDMRPGLRQAGHNNRVRSQRYRCGR